MHFRLPAGSASQWTCSSGPAASLAPKVRTSNNSSRTSSANAKPSHAMPQLPAKLENRAARTVGWDFDARTGCERVGLTDDGGNCGTFGLNLAAQFAQFVQNLRALKFVFGAKFRLPDLLERIPVNTFGPISSLLHQGDSVAFKLLEFFSHLEGFTFGLGSGFSGGRGISGEGFAFAFQVLEEFFDVCAFRPENAAGPLEHIGRQPQPSGNRERI